MSFVVKGADYPKCCAECYAGLDFSGDYPVCRFTGEQRGWTFNVRNQKMDKCPLHDLPTPHGKLIDVDELISDLYFDIELAERCLQNTNCVGTVRKQMQYDKECKQDCIDYIRYTPAIIEAEE